MSVRNKRLWPQNVRLKLIILVNHFVCCKSLSNVLHCGSTSCRRESRNDLTSAVFFVWGLVLRLSYIRGGSKRKGSHEFWCLLTLFFLFLLPQGSAVLLNVE